MAIFTIFWCAVLGVVFWILSMILKLIQSAIISLFDTVRQCGSISIKVFREICFLLLIYIIYDGIGEINFFLLLLLGVILFFLAFFIKTMGAEVIYQLVEIVMPLINLIIKMFDFFDTHIFHAYEFFLNKIKQKVDLM